MRFAPSANEPLNNTKAKQSHTKRVDFSCAFVNGSFVFFVVRMSRQSIQQPGFKPNRYRLPLRIAQPPHRVDTVVKTRMSIYYLPFTIY